MNEELKNTRVDVQPQAVQSAKEKRKKKYSKPSMIYQAPLEAMAAACTPGPPNFGKAGASCTLVRS